MFFFNAFPREYLQEKLEQSCSHHCSLKAHSGRVNKQGGQSLKRLLTVDSECCGGCGVDGQIPRGFVRDCQMSSQMWPFVSGVSYHMIAAQHDTQPRDIPKDQSQKTTVCMSYPTNVCGSAPASEDCSLGLNASLNFLFIKCRMKSHIHIKGINI